MSKNIEEIVDSILPTLDSSSFRDRGYLREALTNKVLCVPMSEGNIFEIVKNSHFIDTKADIFNSREEKENWLEEDCFKSLAKAIYQAQFGGNK